MNILTPEDAESLAELLIDDIPLIVHNLIAHNHNISEADVVGKISRIFPSTVDVEIIRNRCIASIRWFVHNGDIANSGNRRYVMLPVYGVIQGESDASYKIKICGDNRYDETIKHAIEQFSCRLETKLENWYWQGNESKEKGTVGFRREIAVPLKEIKFVTKKLMDLLLTFVMPVDFQERLPSIENVKTPAITAFNQQPPSWGEWLVYDPLIQDEIRWKVSLGLSFSDNPLYKWKPSDDWKGENNARFFLNQNHERLAELSSSSARIWMYYLDNQCGNNRSVWVSGSVLFVPEEMPESHQHWLQLIAMDWYKEGRYTKYHLVEDAGRAAEILSSTLRLRILRGNPVFK